MSNLVAVSDMLTKNKSQFLAAIPQVSGLSPDRLIRVALTEFRKNAYLQNCDPVSFCGAVMQAAQLGLEFGEVKHCALVPYKNECKLMIMYQGYLALLWRSKSVTNVQAKVVYEGDEFEVSFGSRTRLHHVPKFKSTKATHFYAGATPVGGEFMFEVMSYEQVAEHRDKYARGLDKRDSPWNTSFDAMALKTVIRKMIKLLPLAGDSPIHQAIESENKDYIDVQPEKIMAIQEQGAQELDLLAEHEVAINNFTTAYLKAKDKGVAVDEMIKDADKFLSEATTDKVIAATNMLMQKVGK